MSILFHDVTRALRVLRKTPGFFANATKRLTNELEGAYQFAQTHFGGANLYMDAVRQNIRFIVYTALPLAPASGFHPKLLSLIERRQVRVPSLAERPEDVEEIALFFLRQHARRIGAARQE